MTKTKVLPMIKPSPLLFVISGPSGSGKGTALDYIETEFKHDISRCPTYTTRPKRKGERQGQDYNFVTQAQFDEFVEAGKIFEFTRTYNDELYGSPRTLVNTEVPKHLLVELDFNGFHRIKTISHRQVIGIFVMPPSIEELSKRILARSPETNIERRLQRVSEQIAHSWSYHYIILNQDRDEFIKRLDHIVSSELYRHDGLNFLTEHWAEMDVTLAKGH